MPTSLCVRAGRPGESVQTCATTDVSQSSTTAAALASLTIPANRMRIGTTFHLYAAGAITGSHGSLARTVTYTLRYGGTTGTIIATTGTMAIPTGIGTDQKLELMGTFTLRTIGSTGTAQGSIQMINAGVTAAQKDYIFDAGATAVTIDTTAASALVLTCVGSGSLTTHRGDIGWVRMVRA